MIAIIPIATGQPLDLAPDAEFDIQMEQPLLSDELPAPFSTQISFPPTARNNKVFGFAGYETLFEPTHKKVYCRLEIFGLPWMNGTLVYDGIEDGNLQYTFTGQDILGLDSKTGNSANGQFPVRLNLSTMGTYAGDNGRYPIMAPLILNEGQQASLNGTHQGATDISVKFKNYYGYIKEPGEIDKILSKTEFIFTPALNILDCFLSVMFQADGTRPLSVSSSLQAYLAQLAIVCPYKNKTWEASIQTVNGSERIKVSNDTIPNLTAKDIVENVCKILCAAIYIENNSVHLMNAADVLDGDFYHLDESIISDVHSCSILRAQNYSFKFGNDDSENSYTPRTGQQEEDAPIYSSLSGQDDFWDSTVGDLGEYQAFRHMERIDDGHGFLDFFEDIINRKFHNPGYDVSASYILCDNLFHNMGTCENDAGSDDSRDRSTSWKLVRCVPQVIWRPGNGNVTRAVMTPIIPAVSVDEDRGDMVYVGLLKDQNAQLVDKGFYFDNTNATEILYDGISLAPKDLKTSLHKRMADWVSKDRQVLKVSLNVTVSYLIDGLKLWRRYYFAGRYWLIKSLTVHCSAKADKPEVEAEFVEC